MAKPTITFDVHFTVPIGALEKLVGLASDLGCGLVAADPNLDQMVPTERKQVAAFVGNMTDAKGLVLARLKQDKGLVNRRVIIRDLRAKGYQKNSVGPLCTELKRAGLITNPRRGYWTIPERVATNSNSSTHTDGP